VVFSVGFAVFSNVLWWLGGFFCSGFVFFLLLMALALPALVFSTFFGGDSGLMSISWLELAPPELNNGSCVYGEGGDIEGREDGLGDDNGRDCGGSVGGIDPSVWDYNVTFGPQYDTVNHILECPFPVTSRDV
jgi:hypothetical protein